jgi:hypothetical protein
VSAPIRDPHYWPPLYRTGLRAEWALTHHLEVDGGQVLVLRYRGKDHTVILGKAACGPQGWSLAVLQDVLGRLTAAVMADLLGEGSGVRSTPAPPAHPAGSGQSRSPA